MCTLLNNNNNSHRSNTTNSSSPTHYSLKVVYGSHALVCIIHQTWQTFLQIITALVARPALSKPLTDTGACACAYTYHTEHSF